MKTNSFIFADYAKRIGFIGKASVDLPTLQSLMRAQLFTVPFENLDVQAGKVVSIDPEDIVNKIVYHSRGGYCYEVNGLFAIALASLNIDYYFVGARPMFYPARRPKTHMVVIAKIAGEEYLCDLGFGSFGIRAPIALSNINQVIQQDDDFFRLASDDNKNYIVQALVDGEWVDQYGFDLYPHELLDFIPANFLNSKSPDTIFVQKLLIVQHYPAGRKILLGTRLKTIEKGESQFRDLAPDDLGDFIKSEFNLLI